MRRLAIALAVMLLPRLAFGTVESDFWAWFKQNDSQLFNFEKDQQKVFADLSNHLQAVDPNLTFEFGPIHGNSREFVISAGGIKDSFPAVERLYGSAPKLDHWIWIKFRPRREPMDIVFNGVTVSPGDISFTIEADGKEVGLTLFIKGYRPDPKKTYEQIAYLMLDSALGEYDVETKVGAIDFTNESTDSKLPKHPFAELPKLVDQFSLH